MATTAYTPAPQKGSRPIVNHNLQIAGSSLNTLHFFGLRRSPIGSILAAQILVAGLLAVCLLAVNERIAVSALLGSWICIIPNMYLAYKLTAKRTADPNKLTTTFYTAELGKIIITATLFAAAFATQKWIQPVALISGYGVAQLTHWITPLWLTSTIRDNRDN